MSRIKFDGFTENYDVSKTILGPSSEHLVSETIMEIVHRYKDPDPAFPTTSYIEKINFSKGPFTPSWRLNFNGELYTNSDAIANGLVNDTRDPKKNDGGLGLIQTFKYQGDTFQVYVNFRGPIID